METLEVAFVLKQNLTAINRTLDELDPTLFLSPFLDVIRSEVVTGPVTGLALDAMQKFLSYELLHVDTRDAANAVENIADAVTHARSVIYIIQITFSIVGHPMTKLSAFWCIIASPL